MEFRTRHVKGLSFAVYIGTEPPLYSVRYSPSRIADAVAHVSQAGRTGVVLSDFSND
jgi:hypothetical protein